MWLVRIVWCWLLMWVRISVVFWLFWRVSFLWNVVGLMLMLCFLILRWLILCVLSVVLMILGFVVIVLCIWNDCMNGLVIVVLEVR